MLAMGKPGSAALMDTPTGQRDRASRITGTGPRPFNFSRWFLLLSFASIMLTSALSTFFISRFLTENMLKRDAVVTKELINSIVHAGGGKSLFQHRPDAEQDTVLDKLFSQIANIPDILRASVYNRDRTILWSSDPEFIGVAFNTNSDLDRAFSGHLVIESGIIGEVRKAEHAFLEDDKGKGTRFIENYIPVTEMGSEEVIGVFEVYKAPEALFSAVDTANRLVWLTAAAGGLVLYLALFWIVKRTSAVLLAQQDRLIANETMAAIGEMASAVAHGLRNPLASIRSSAELALQDCTEAPTRESLTDVITQADRLEAWIRELLTGTRPAVMELVPLDIVDLIEDCLDGYQGEFQRRGITLELNLDTTTALITGNRAALRQVFNSLISNAVEAMPSSGTLTLTTSVEDSGKYVVVRMVDSGTGIPDGQVGRILEAFVTTKGSGVGIGLTLARRIVERHAGTLRLAQAEGGGAVASVRIPVAD